jgi:hypothetical protein
MSATRPRVFNGQKRALPGISDLSPLEDFVLSSCSLGRSARVRVSSRRWRSSIPTNGYDYVDQHDLDTACADSHGTFGRDGCGQC